MDRTTPKASWYSWRTAFRHEKESGGDFHRLNRGRKAGVFSVLGIATGALIHTLAAALGLSLLLTTSASLFHVLKIAGSVYLIYLGIRMMIEKSTPFENRQPGFDRTDLRKIYLQGVLTDVLNPKVALFFLSFLPQFINTAESRGPVPFLILGGTFVTTGTSWCLFLAYAASYVTKTLREKTHIARRLQKISGLIFIGLGLQIALSKG